MTDFAASSLATVADHRCVQTTVQFKVSETLTNQCEVWHFKYEDLEKLHRKIDDSYSNTLPQHPKLSVSFINQ